MTMTSGLLEWGVCPSSLASLHHHQSITPVANWLGLFAPPPGPPEPPRSIPVPCPQWLLGVLGRAPSCQLQWSGTGALSTGLATSLGAINLRRIQPQHYTKSAIHINTLSETRVQTLLCSAVPCSGVLGAPGKLHFGCLEPSSSAVRRCANQRGVREPPT